MPLQPLGTAAGTEATQSFPLPRTGAAAHTQRRLRKARLGLPHGFAYQEDAVPLGTLRFLLLNAK